MTLAKAIHGTTAIASPVVGPTARPTVRHTAAPPQQLASPTARHGDPHSILLLTSVIATALVAALATALISALITALSTALATAVTAIATATAAALAKSCHGMRWGRFHGHAVGIPTPRAMVVPLRRAKTFSE